MKRTIITILAAASVLAVAQEPMKLPIFNSSGGIKAHLATKQDAVDVIWALKAAMRQFRPEPKDGQWVNPFRIEYSTGMPEDTSSPEYFRRLAKEMEEKAKAVEQQDADRKRAYEILSKWEKIEKELSE
jgi:hypothetical protein